MLVRLPKKWKLLMRRQMMTYHSLPVAPEQDLIAPAVAADQQELPPPPVMVEEVPPPAAVTNAPASRQSTCPIVNQLLSTSYYTPPLLGSNLNAQGVDGKRAHHERTAEGDKLGKVSKSRQKWKRVSRTHRVS